MLYIWWENKFNKIKGNVKNYFSFQNTVSAKGETEKYISLKLYFQKLKNKKLDFQKLKKKLDFQKLKIKIRFSKIKK